MFRVSQSLGQLAIICQQDQSSATRIEAADREESSGRWHQFDNAWATIWIAIRTQEPLWFMDCIVHGPMPFERLAIHGYFRNVSVDFDTHLRYQFSIDLHPPIGDEFVDLAAGPEARGGEKFVDTLLSR